MDAKEKIRQYLHHRAAEDEQFAKCYAKPDKSLDECMKYILTEAKKHGNAVCMDDEEVYGLAVHYYDEDSVEIDRTLRAEVATSNPKQDAIELTEEEKAEARREAQRRNADNLVRQMEVEGAKPKPRKKKEDPTETTPSLFDL